MPDYLAPGVYVEEIPLRSSPIEGVSTSTVGFIGASARAPQIGPLTSFLEFQRAAQSNATANLSLAVRGFFENGGTRCYVARIAPGDPFETALEAMADEKISVVCCPDENSIPNAAAAMAAHCDRLKDRVCILQSPQSVIADSAHQPPVHSSYAAYYHPWVTVRELGWHYDGHDSSGWACGWNLRENGYQSGSMERACGCIASWSAGSFRGHHYRAIRSSRRARHQRSPRHSRPRLPSLERSHDGPPGFSVEIRQCAPPLRVRRAIHPTGLQWAVSEQNGHALWIAVRTTISNFLQNLWTSGALQGAKPEQAYFICCDRTTMTQSDIDAGRLVAEIGLAPTRPAEFVILRILCQTSQGLAP